MHGWAQGWGSELSGPDDDIVRRMSEIRKLEDNYEIKSVLDFGCGSGEMLQELSAEYHTMGIEPDAISRKEAEKTVGLGLVFQSSEAALAQGIQVDAITLFHVIEHFYYPSQELEKIHKLLVPGGLLIVETPNSCDALLTDYDSSEFQNFTYWSHHPMLHSPESLNLLLERNQFKILHSTGVQRYDLGNHLYWLSAGRPGGHEYWKEKFSKETLQSYARDLIASKKCDTLWIVAEKVG
jgi:cyclopropane fatty-acyl-phospholipid synthase-like methyltransferase